MRPPRKKPVQRAILLLAALLLLLAILCRACETVHDRTERAEENLPALQICLLDHESGELLTMDLEEYLVHVVAAEMPASFAPAALQAQAIAARTYTLRRLPPYGQPKHGQASLCTDSACCQAYRNTAELRESWGHDFAANEGKIRDAVAATAGIVLCYQGALAETPFHSTCGGSTEAAADCWQTDIAYLQPVACVWDMHSPRFTSSRSLSLEEAAALLDLSVEELRSLQPAGDTAGGRLRTATAGGKSWRGTELRSLLGLDSAAFRWLILGERIIFTSVGYGHGVGLCQYGADGMATAGYSSAQILSHYYPGTALGRLTAEGILAAPAAASAP